MVRFFSAGESDFSLKPTNFEPFFFNDAQNESLTDFMSRRMWTKTRIAGKEDVEN